MFDISRYSHLETMKYYHGSRSKFESFSIKGQGKHGLGFYFTADKYEAMHFARSLYGNGVDKEPTVYTVQLKARCPFDTMNSEHCQVVMNQFGLTFRPNKNAGGAKEQYYYLSRQLKTNGIEVDVNQAIESAGFDAVFWEFSNHMILFKESQIEILEIEPVQD